MVFFSPPPPDPPSLLVLLELPIGGGVAGIEVDNHLCHRVMTKIFARSWAGKNSPGG